MDRNNVLLNLLSRCDIYIENMLINKENILQTVSGFLKDDYLKEEHSTSILLHPGSICYDALLFSIHVLANMVLDENDRSFFEVGQKYTCNDSVIYEYKGLYDGDDKKLQNRHEFRAIDRTITRYENKNGLIKFIPYNGNAKSSGKGLKKNKSKRQEFLKELGIPVEEISAFPRSSSVVFVDLAKLEYLVNNVVIGIGDAKYKLLDLTTVTYYTLSKERRFAGNSNNFEPEIKATSSIEKARELVFDSGNHTNEVIGFLCLQYDVLRRNPNDLEKLLKRKKLVYSWLAMKFAYDVTINNWLDSEECKYKILALTPRMINHIDVNIINPNKLTRELYEQNVIISKRKITGQYVKSKVLKKDFFMIKDKLRYVLDNSFDSEEVMRFTRWVYSKLKFFNNAFFTMEEYEEYLSSIDNQIGLMEEIEGFEQRVENYSMAIQEKCFDVIKYLKKLYNANYDNNPKKDKLEELISGRNGADNYLFVIPSAGYRDMLDYFLRDLQKRSVFLYHIISESRIMNIDLSQYDYVIYPSIMNTEKINPLDLVSATHTVIYMYDSQYSKYKRTRDCYVSYLEKLNNVNSYISEDEKSELLIEDNYDKSFDNVMDKEETELDENIQNRFVEHFIQYERYRSSQEYGSSNASDFGYLDAYAHGQFVSGEQIIFSDGYEAYVIDTLTGETKCKSVNELQNGDKIVFTVNDNKTKDIVGELFDIVLQNDKNVAGYHKYVLDWKEKLSLYKDTYNLTYTELCKRLKKKGKTISPAGLRMWIDPNSYLVGPKAKNAVDTFRVIGETIGDSVLVEECEKYAEATRVVRRERTSILKQIEKVVLDDVIGTKIESDENNSLIDKIREIAVVKQLESITLIEESFKISAGRANRPINT